MMDITQSIVDVDLPTINVIYRKCCLEAADTSLNAHTTLATLVVWLQPLGRRYRSLRTVNSRFKSICFPSPTKFLNHSAQP